MVSKSCGGDGEESDDQLGDTPRVFKLDLIYKKSEIIDDLTC